MWLLNTSTMTLEERDAQDTRYALLSHRWEDEELHFAAMRRMLIRLAACAVVALTTSPRMNLARCVTTIIQVVLAP